MRKTLENIAGAVDRRQFLKSLSAAVAFPFVKTATRAAEIITPQSQEENHGVYLTMEPQNGIGFLLHNMPQDASGFDIHIYADNTTEADPTATVEFKIKAPSCVENPRTYLLTPYVTGYDDFILGSSLERDFFYPQKINPQANYVRSQDAKRSIMLSSVPGSTPQQLQGVQKKYGKLGIIRYDLKSGTSLGRYQFEITGTAKKSNGAEQPTKGSTVTINIVRDQNYLDSTHIINQDFNYAPGATKKVPYLHVSGSYSQPVELQISSDLKSWKTIVKSSINARDYMSNLKKDVWAPFDFIDKDAEFADKRFYRLYVAP